jgi:dihydroorotate dehydrogenase electron transfer subunit
MSLPTYADHAWHGPVVVAENATLARDTFRLRFACPEIARRITPGQFVMLRVAGCNDPLLGRPLAMYDVAPDAAGKPHFLDVVYLTVGKMTRILPELVVGSRLEVWGPLGNGFLPTPKPTEHLVMVAGGIGQTPFLSLAKEYLGVQTYGDPPRRVPRAHKVTLCYGAKTRDYLACVEDFRRTGATILLSTDDGSQAHRGFVTELIQPVVEKSVWPCRIVCCGPERMMEATSEIARKLNVPCQISLESPMACGIGACFSCVTKIRDASGGWDYRRTCIEGPVFEAENVQF